MPVKIDGRDFMVRGKLVRVASLESDGFDFPHDPDAIIKGLERAGSGVDIFTFVQTLPHVRPRFDYHMEWDNFAALPISTFDRWWSEIDFKVRNKARKGEKKGLSVREVEFDDSLVRGISAIYNESPVRQGKPFWHYGKPIEAVRQENSSFLDRSILIGAFFEDRLIGFIKLIIDKDHGQAGVMQILSMIGQRDKAPTNALIAQAVKSCAERRIPYFVYSNFSYGKKQRDSLADFKESNGFQRIEIPRFYVPVTVKGRLALMTGCHQRLAERIPEPLLAKARTLRNLWYARTVPSQKEAV